MLTAKDQVTPDTARPPALAAGTVLIVEDDEPTREILRRVLESAGFECRLAHDGEEGVRLAIVYRPGVILMDLSMPKLSGLGALAEIRQDYRARSTPVILLTANGNVDSVVAHLAAGADDYLVKPVAPAELVARVKLALQRAAMLRDLNALTGLPGNAAILREIAVRLSAGRHLACMHADVDAFKAFNDHYGFARGDLAIRATAEALLDALDAAPSPQHFAGHIGGDDFVVLTAPDLAEPLAREFIERFDAVAPGLYDAAEREQGWVEVWDRRRQLHRAPLMSISIGIARTDTHPLDSPVAVAASAGEMKAVAKLHTGSSVAVDQRRGMDV
ncbi:MAG: GGDEF domain-containing response regulator [Solirubrobacteraceae bacterium]